MASRPELVEMCRELEIDCTDLSIEEMKVAVREGALRKFIHGRKKYSADGLSTILKKFLTLEGEFVLKDKEGNRVNYRGEKIHG